MKREVKISADSAATILLVNSALGLILDDGLTTESIEELETEYQEISQQINQLEKRKTYLAERVKRHMGDRHEVRIDDFIIRFQAVESNRFDLSSFKEQHGDLYKAFTRHTITRRFSIA